jgi:hypothetical protein
MVPISVIQQLPNEVCFNSSAHVEVLELYTPFSSNTGNAQLLDPLNHSKHRRLVDGFSPQRAAFTPRAVHVGFVVDKVAPGQVFLRVVRFSPVNTIPPLLYIHSCIIWGMNNGPFSGLSSTETKSQPL